jgi:hypothetical protein
MKGLYWKFSSSEAKQRPTVMAFTTTKSAHRTTARAHHVHFDLRILRCGRCRRNESGVQERNGDAQQSVMTRSGAFLKKRGLLRCRVQENHGALARALSSIFPAEFQQH